MVKEIEQGTKTLYTCGECVLAYEEKEWAEKCQSQCETHGGSCNIEYVVHSVPLDEKPEQFYLFIPQFYQESHKQPPRYQLLASTSVRS